jgi:hypothetical protein
MSPKKISCPSCAKAFQLKPELEGKKVRCPKCQTPFVIKFQDPALATTPQIVAAEPTVVAVAEVVEPIPVEPIPVEPIAVEPISVKSSPAKPVPVELAPAASAQPASAPAPLAAKQPAINPVLASPYEALATNLMSHSHSAAAGHSNDYVSLNRRLKQQRQGTRADVDDDSMRFLFRGVALMIFGLCLLGLAFLGLRFSGVSNVSPIGGLIGAVCGATGAIMVIVGFHRRIGSALFFGAFPGLFFLAATGLVITLFYQGYWYSPLDNVPGFTSFNSSLPPGARNALAKADEHKNWVERNRRKNGGSSNSLNSPRPTQNNPTVNRRQPTTDRSNPQTQPNRPIFEDDPFAAMRKANQANSNRLASPPVENKPSVSNNNPPPRKPIEDDNPFGRSTTNQSQPDNRDMAPPLTASESENPFGDSSDDASRPATTTPSPNSSVSTIPFPGFGGPGMANLAQRQGTIRSAMFRKYKGQATFGFPPKRLTKAAGTPRGRSLTYLTMDRPLLGLDAMNSMRKDGLYSLVPVYSANEDALTIAKTGYAIGGLNVNTAGDSILGFQCIFMKLDGNELDTEDSYLGDWIGEKPAGGSEVLVGGDGRMVSGVWFEGGLKVNAIGLIHASN